MVFEIRGNGAVNNVTNIAAKLDQLLLEELTITNKAGSLSR